MANALICTRMKNNKNIQQQHLLYHTYIDRLLYVCSLCSTSSCNINNLSLPYVQSIQYGRIIHTYELYYVPQVFRRLRIVCVI